MLRHHPYHFIIKPDGTEQYIGIDKPFNMTLGHPIFTKISTDGYIAQYILKRLALKYNCHFIYSFEQDEPLFLTDHEIADLDKLYPRFLVPSIGASDRYSTYDRPLLPRRHFIIPQNDETARLGIESIMPDTSQQYDDKINKVFWRGSYTGRHHKLRLRMVQTLGDNEFCDIRFIETQWNKIEDSIINRKYIAEPVGIDSFLQHKYLMIVDGWSIPGGCDLTFASGCTPIYIGKVISFLMGFAQPWKHYIPFNFDESIDEQLEVIRRTGKNVAKNAKILATNILNPTFIFDRIEENIKIALATEGI